jgi:F-type H+-transporting ATPase subunit delta
MALVTSRYARAFADVVFDVKLDAQQALRELRNVEEVQASSVDLRRVWDNPSIPAEQKRHLLDAIAGKLGLQKPVRNFIAVLIDHQRIGMLSEITNQFEREVNDRMGLAEADVTSARELSEQERRELEAQLIALTGKRVVARYATDGNLLGGAMVRIGSTIYDGSVLGQLQRIREQLSS